MKFIYMLFVPTFSLNLCINCKHFKKDMFTPTRFAKCKKFMRVDYNVEHLISGKKENQDMYYCSTARTSIILCGEDGTGYEAK